MTNSPIPMPELEKLTEETCASVFANTHTYDHSKTASWNTSIINTLLARLVAQTSTSGKPPKFKFVVTSTIMQHASSPLPASRPATATQDGGSEREEGGKGGRRGMHCASGAYWNKERDGMGSVQWEGEGFEVVVTVVWIGV